MTQSPDEAMAMYTVYDHPADIPDAFVVRRFLIRAGAAPEATGDVFSADTLKRVRSWIMLAAPDSVCIGRSPEDDPVIVETWF